MEKVFTTLQSILHETLANLEIHQSLLHIRWWYDWGWGGEGEEGWWKICIYLFPFKESEGHTKVNNTGEAKRGLKSSLIINNDPMVEFDEV